MADAGDVVDGVLFRAVLFPRCQAELWVFIESVSKNSPSYSSKLFFQPELFHKVLTFNENFMKIMSWFV